MRWELKVTGLVQCNKFSRTLVTGSKVFPSMVYALCPASQLCLEACLELPFVMLSNSACDLVIITAVRMTLHPFNLIFIL